jgi:transcriptional regulator with XRE-family HTH domain
VAAPIGKRGSDHVAFVTLVKMIRTQKNMSQKDVADGSGRSQQWVSKVETMETVVAAWDLKPLAKGLRMEGGEDELWRLFKDVRDEGVLRIASLPGALAIATPREDRALDRRKASRRRRRTS